MADFNNVRFPGQPISPKASAMPAQKAVPAAASFAQVWQETLQQQSAVKFSAHAVQRMCDRKIELGAADVAKINDAVKAAEKKGARSSLLLYKDMAFVASVKNRTIITALDSADMAEHVFTNIDSAVIVR